jgi:hypothetical protein
MTIARYYVRRLSSSFNNTLTVRAPNPWTWARVRGQDAQGNQLSSIQFNGANDRVLLTVPASSAGARYEIVLGDQQTDPNDSSLRPPGQPRIYSNNVTLNNPQGFERMDRDPPPPPDFDWDLGTPVDIT